MAKPRDFLGALDSSKKEHRGLIDENLTLQSKLGKSLLFSFSFDLDFRSEKLENDLRDLIEKNRENYERINRDYRQLERNVPELDCLLVNARDSAVSLGSEIITYRYLLTYLLSSPAPVKEETKKKSQREYRDDRTGLIVHIEDGLIWVRI